MAMPKGMNTNRPQKGSRIVVEPIRKLKNIKSIKKMLQNHPRNFCLFVLGINSNLRASDLLRITYGMVKDLQPGDDLVIREKKTGKERRITINTSVHTAIQGLIDPFNNSGADYTDNDPIFKSQRGDALKVPAVTALVKKWCLDINLKGNFGSHTLRKTFGYHQRITFNVALPELMVCFNHSSQRQTLDYLCIQPSEIRKIYENEI